MNPNNARKTVLNTDYPIDQVIYIAQGSFSMTGISGSYTFNHGLPFTPLIDGVWSLTPDFAVTYNMGSGVYPSGNLATPWLTEIEINNRTNDGGAEPSIIRIGWLNLGSNATVYYRIYGLEPSDVSPDLSFTNNAGDNFITNTDYNYQKVYKTGFIPSLAASSTYTVDHNLGWRPRVAAWGLLTGGLRYPMQLNRNDTTNSFGAKISTTATQLIIRTDSFYNPAGGAVPTRIDYRIYIDEAGNG